MTQYLLSVWHDRDATPEDIYPSDEERQEAYAATGAFNEELQRERRVGVRGRAPPADDRDGRRRHRHATW